MLVNCGQLWSSLVNLVNFGNFFVILVIFGEFWWILLSWVNFGQIWLISLPYAPVKKEMELHDIKEERVDELGSDAPFNLSNLVSKWSAGQN